MTKKDTNNKDKKQTKESWAEKRARELKTNKKRIIGIIAS